jgi:hypothetical protein
MSEKKKIILKLRFLETDILGNGHELHVLTVEDDDDWEDEPMAAILTRLGARFVRETKKRVEWELSILDTHPCHYPWNWPVTVTKGDGGGSHD